MNVVRRGVLMDCFDLAPLDAKPISWSEMEDDAAAYMGGHGACAERPAMVVSYVFDHGGDLGFNDVMKGFVREAAERSGISAEDVAKVSRMAHVLLDEGCAELFFARNKA